MRTLTFNRLLAIPLLSLALSACPGDDKGDTGDDGTTTQTTPSTQTDPTPGTTTTEGTTVDPTTGPDGTDTTNTTPPVNTTSTDDSTDDTGPDDTGPDDTSTDDTGPDDTGPGDTSTDDTGPDDTSTGPDDTSTTESPVLTWSGDIYPNIVGPSCGCHMGGSGGLAMGPDAQTSFDAMVGVGSVDIPAMPLIDPGMAMNSYMWHKVNGSHQGVGGAGSQMPLGGQLTPDEVNLIAQWIDEGAVF